MRLNTSQQKHGSLMLAKGYFLAIMALVVLSACFAFLMPRETEAVTTVPTRMNFQGRLVDSTGNIKANGSYNMRFRLYTAASGGTAVWTEDRLVAASQGVTLTNGLFSVQLGSVTSLPASLFASGALYLEVELPTPGTATSASPSWTEGAMSPRNQMATSAYAYNSELLDGQDGDYYRDATNLNAGTLNTARITGSYTGLTGTGALVAGSIASGFGTIATGNTIQGSQLISTIATGTAPLVVTSTTKVNNLNVDMLDGLDSSAFVVREAVNSEDISLRTQSGFYQSSTASTAEGWPLDSNSWMHLMSSTHSNTSNYYAMQFSGSFYNSNDVFYRSTNGSGATAWNRLWHSGNDGASSGLDADTLDGLSSASFLTSTTGVQLQGTTPGVAQTGNINVSGTVIASGFSGSGSGLTNLSASSLSSGTVNTARVSGAYTGITGTGALTAGSIGSGFGSINTGSTIATTGSLQGGSLSVGGNLVLTMPSNNPERGAYNPIWSSVGTGKAIYNDEEFATGVNNVAVYNNSGGSAVTITRETGVVGVPNATGNQLKVSYDGIGATSPNFGGVIQPINPTANKTYVQRFRAKVPVGKILNIHENAQGTNNTSYWLTNNVGTGKWEDYMRVSHAGNTGTFSVGGHISISGGSGSFDWYIASMNVFEVSSSSTAGGGSYIQNSTSPQTANFNITGNGVIGGQLSIGGGTAVLTGNSLTADGFTIDGGSDIVLTATNGIEAQTKLTVNAGMDVYTQSRFMDQNSKNTMTVDTVADIVEFGQASTADTFTKLTNPASLPTGTGNNVSYSPDGMYMSVPHFTSPFVTIYKRSGDTFTKLPNPATLPTGTGYGTAFSPDGQYMSVAHATAPYITIYKRSGDTFTKLADPAALPSGIGISVTFSPDGSYMAVGANTAPFLVMYKRSGDTFTKLTDPTTPGSAGNDVDFSPDGAYLSVTSQSAPYANMYRRLGDQFIKLADPATLPTGNAYEGAFSSDGQYLAYAHFTSPYVTIYKRSGTTFTKLANPATLPTSTGRGVDFSLDGKYMVVGTDLPPYVYVYKRSGDTFTKLADLGTQPTGGVVGVSFSPSGQYVSISHNNSPYITTYRVGSGNAVEVALNGALASTGVLQGGSLKVTGHSSLLGGASVLGTLDVQGRASYVQTEGESPGLRVQGRSSAQLFDVNIFEVVDANGNVMLGANQGAGRRVSIIGGSGFWNTAALEVYTAESGGRGISIKGSSGQTADYIRVIDSSNNQLFSVSANGSVVTAASLQGASLNLSGSASVGGSVSAGSMYSSGWFYSTGDTGWYNSTYGGGIRMMDTSWIRTYGSKYFYAESGLDTGGPSGVNCGGGLGGGYTFQVCGSQRVTGGLHSDSTLSIGNANFQYGNPNSLSGIYMCKRTSDNIVAMGSSCSLASSARYKENISSISTEKALDILSKLRAVGFDWRSGVGDFTAANGGKADYGVIAEEIEAILPELVTKDAQGQTIGVNYTGLIPFLISVAQEQQTQIAQLQGARSTVDELTVNGSATIGSDLNVSGMTNLKNLTVNGDAVVAGKLEVKGLTSVQSILVNGHIITGGNALSIQPSSLFGADELMATVEGNDTTGTITFTLDDQATMPSGINLEDGASILGATFAQQFGATPRILISPANANAGNLKAFTSSESRDGFNISVGSLPQQGKTYKFTYWVAQ